MSWGFPTFYLQPQIKWAILWIILKSLPKMFNNTYYKKKEKQQWVTTARAWETASKTGDKTSSQQASRRSSVSRSRSNSMWGLTNDDDDMGDGYSRYHDDESNALDEKPISISKDIPPIFTDPKVMEQYYVTIDKQSRNNNGQQQAWLHPPQLPPHLESVILNNFNNTENNSGALPIQTTLCWIIWPRHRSSTIHLLWPLSWDTKKVFDTSFIRTTTTSFTVFHNTEQQLWRLTS